LNPETPVRSAQHPSSSVATIEQGITPRSTYSSRVTQTRTSISQGISFDEHIKDLARFVFDFGAAVKGAKPTRVFLQFENVGRVPVVMSFFFSRDEIVDVDHWARDEMPKNQREWHEELVMTKE